MYGLCMGGYVAEPVYPPLSGSHLIRCWSVLVIYGLGAHACLSIHVRSLARCHGLRLAHPPMHAIHFVPLSRPTRLTPRRRRSSRL